MRTIRHTATALLTSVLLIGSCGTEVPREADAGSSASPQAGAATVTSEELSLERIDGRMAAGDYGRVVELLGASGDQGALEPEAAQRLVQALWAESEVPRAVRVARTMLTREPGATMVARILTEIYVSLDQYPLAVKTLQAARAHGAADSEIALTLGVCLGRMGDLAGARAEFERAAQAGDSLASVEYNLAVLLINDHQHAEAEGLLRSVLTSQPGNLDARRELARMLLYERPDEDDRRAEAVTSLNSVLDQREDDWRANELMGDAYMAYGDPEAAVYFYTEALRHGLNPPRVEAKYVTAVKANNELLAEQGLLPETPREVDRSGPPIPDGVRERWKQANKEAREQAAKPDPGPTQESDDGQQQGQ